MTLGMIFPADGTPSTESPALIRIAILLLFPEYFFGLFGHWSVEKNLLSIDPLDLLRLSQHPPAKQVLRLTNTSPAQLGGPPVFSFWELLKVGVKIILYSTINMLSPLYLSLEVREMRLLRFLPRYAQDQDDPIECELTNLPIGTALAPFDALSYCWGPQDQEQNLIFVNGHQMYVNETSHDILHHLRH
jgi:hypothetical protein